LTETGDLAVSVGMDAATKAPPPPDGFAEMNRKGEYWRMTGPYFERARENGVEQALLAAGKHANALGLVHGGMLSAFLDGLLFQAVKRTIGERSAITLHLSVDFLAAAKIGEWVIGESTVTRESLDIVFVEGRVHSAGRDVARASGLFKPTRPAGS
jgi:acyl-coenzyme A thioesterase PaaI-like protein